MDILMDKCSKTSQNQVSDIQRIVLDLKEGNIFC